MLFFTRRDKFESPVLKIDGVDIKFCESAKYLGVIVDNKLRLKNMSIKL